MLGLNWAWAQVLKQKRLYEGQRDQLYSQQFNLEQTTFVMESAKDTVNTVQALKATSKDMKQAFKSKELDISSIEKLQDELADFAVRQDLGPSRLVRPHHCAASPCSGLPAGPRLYTISPAHILVDMSLFAHLQDINSEIQDVMGQNFALPYDIDEDELMGELDGMEDELASEFETGGGAPSYMQVSFALQAGAKCLLDSLSTFTSRAWVNVCAGVITVLLCRLAGRS